jgi:hypothetical protein
LDELEIDSRGGDFTALDNLCDGGTGCTGKVLGDR